MRSSSLNGKVTKIIELACVFLCRCGSNVCRFGSFFCTRNTGLWILILFLFNEQTINLVLLGSLLLFKFPLLNLLYNFLYRLPSHAWYFPVSSLLIWAKQLFWQRTQVLIQAYSTSLFQVIFVDSMTAYVKTIIKIILLCIVIVMIPAVCAFCESESLFWPVFVIATLAAMIASQAMISATFSCIKQSMALGCFPRLKIIHTSRKFMGQIYIPVVNWFLMIMCIVVVSIFQSTTDIANAYG